MNGDVLVQYPNKCLMKRKQTPTHVSHPPKKLPIGGKTKPLSSQRVGHENGHPRVTWLRHLVVPTRTKKYWS
jgi:hypothetical protein